MYHDKLAAFNDIRRECRAYGTLDTEVSCKLRQVLEACFNMDTMIHIPKTQKDWDLYNIEGADAVASKLHHALTEIVMAVDSMTVAEFKKLKTSAVGYSSTIFI